MAIEYVVRCDVGIGLFIRTGPSVSYQIVGTLYSGDTVTVDDVSSKGDGEVWYKIKGSSNWICGYRPSVDNWHYLTIIQDNSSNVNPTPPAPQPPPQSPQPPSRVLGDEYRFTASDNHGSISGDDIKYGNMIPGRGNISVHNVNYSTLGEIDQKYVDPDSIYYQNKMKLTKMDVNANYFKSKEEVDLAMMYNYNLFKVRFPDEMLAKSFGHIFFVRPDLNFFNENGELLEEIAADPTYYEIYTRDPDILKSLCASQTSAHDLNFYLSNKVKSIDIPDQVLETDEVGDNVQGFKMVYGKSIYKSLTAGTFTCSIHDSGTLTTQRMLTAWTQYISDVYMGKLKPKNKYMLGKVLDYATCAYYILCAEDGETIIYACKFYGVFPTNVPTSNLSMSEGQPVSDLKYNVQFQYSFWEPMSLLNMCELNINTVCKNQLTVDNVIGTLGYTRRLYNEYLGNSGNTFVGVPYIISDKNALGRRIFKLKFLSNTTNNPYS